jgi:hypothetical protein
LATPQIDILAQTCSRNSPKIYAVRGDGELPATILSKKVAVSVKIARIDALAGQTQLQHFHVLRPVKHLAGEKPLG